MLAQFCSYRSLVVEPNCAFIVRLKRHDYLLNTYDFLSCCAPLGLLVGEGSVPLLCRALLATGPGSHSSVASPLIDPLGPSSVTACRDGNFIHTFFTLSVMLTAS